MGIEQQNANYEVLIPHYGKDQFVFVSMEGGEYVSECFEFRVSMATKIKAVNTKDLLRKPMVVTIRRAGLPDRHIHGLIKRISLTGRNEDDSPLYFYEAEIVPWLWFLNLEVDCRHFIEMNAVDIIKKVFGDYSYPDFTFKTSTTFPKREFTVQYRESSFNFISRLLEEEGIFYWFEHSENKHQLILADKNSATQVMPGNHKLSYTQGGNSTHIGQIDDLEHEMSSHTGKLTFKDYNFEMSSTSLLTSSSGNQQGEIYDYPGLYQTKADGERYTQLRLEEQEARLKTVHSRSQISALMPGFRIDIADHFDSNANGSYIVLGCSFSCRQNVQGNAAGGAAVFHFSAIPFATQYRPPRKHPRPVIHGIQTAVVVGPPGNEIYCDKFGRVRVQFHWDRKGKLDERSSYWIRVSSAWAGTNWGQISLPRIGQEVIIGFLEGNPDRPIITGRVYNDQQMPPYDLPANQTQSGIKSRSSLGGQSDEFNEFRFEDKRGQEQIYLHAQKDFDEYIENKHTVTVRDNDEVTTIEQGNQYYYVRQGHQETEVNQGNRKITLAQGNTDHLHNVGNHSLECTMGKIYEKAGTEIKMECGMSKITLTPASITLECGGSKIEMVAAMITMTAPMIKQN